MKVLIVEDSKDVVRNLVSNFRKQGIETEVAFDSKSAKNIYSSNVYDTIVVANREDSSIEPNLHRSIREKTESPILLLVEDPKDGLTGLDEGADSYIEMPLDYTETSARVQALLRRNRPLSYKTSCFDMKGFNIDLINRKILSQKGSVQLTRKEYSLLSYLLVNRNRVLTRLNILTHVWDKDIDSFTNTVDVHIASLRRKLGDQEGKFIKTIHCIGYMLAD